MNHSFRLKNKPTSKNEETDNCWIFFFFFFFYTPVAHLAAHRVKLQ